MDFNHYFTNDELEKHLKLWAKDHKDICQLQEIGRSHENKPIWLMTLTDFSTGAAENKPAVWFDANIHSTELAGTTVVLNIIEELLKGKKSGDPVVSRLLATSTFYCAPRLNPDGAERALAKKPEFFRSGVRAYPWSEPEDGIHLEDIDQDGRILQMRIPDPSGDWKVSSLNSKLMQKRRHDENGGQYYRLLPEGRIHNYDGYVIKQARPLAGLDFNRNFPSNWRPDSDQKGAGPFAASEPEIRAMVSFVSSHPNINVALCYHTYSGALLRPYDAPDEKMEAGDLWVYQRLEKRGAELTGYYAGSTYKLLKYHPKETITGTADDWLYDHLGIFTFTVEIWDILKHAGIERANNLVDWFRDHSHEDDVKVLKWAGKNAGKDAYVDWYAFDHPQLGKVELGGWNMLYTWRNPPHGLMGAEAKKNVHFALSMAEVLPHLEVHDLKIEALGNDKHRIVLVVENTGFLPTYTSVQGKKRVCTRPVRAALKLPTGSGLSLISGAETQEFGHLEGRSNKLDLAAFGLVCGPTDNRAKVEWVVSGKPGTKIEITVSGERVGKVVLTPSL
ncbi:MAG: M14 family metallopeptidase [Bdellovibrionota bacterium]